MNLGTVELAGAMLVIFAGIAKTIDPGALANGLALSGIAVKPFLVRVGSMIEGLVGLLVLMTRWPLMGLVLGASYVGFSLFVFLALVRKLPVSSCGCFGEPDTRPTWLHVLLNLVFAGACFGESVAGLSLGESWGHYRVGFPGVLTTLVALAVAFFGYLIMSQLPRLNSVMAETRSY